MVKIVNFKERASEDGSTFYALIIQGGVELIQSKSTGEFYATAKTTSITSTFDEETCKRLLGTEMPGFIGKVVCSPYTITNDETGEITELSSRYKYFPEGSAKAEKLGDDTSQELLTSKTLAESIKELEMA